MDSEQHITMKVSQDEAGLIQRLRVLEKHEFRFVTLDLSKRAIVKKWSDTIEEFARWRKLS